jgi:hypothetical protein
MTTAAAQGYCLARHPYIAAPAATAPYTAEGFEVAASPGIVAAVRRNFVYNRTRPKRGEHDIGQANSCADACQQWGQLYAPSYSGAPLRYRSSDTAPPIANGVGDMASLAQSDWDFYRRKPQVAAITGRPLNFHESDVAQADLCCCHLAPPLAETVTKSRGEQLKQRDPRQEELPIVPVPDKQ